MSSEWPFLPCQYCHLGWLWGTRQCASCNCALCFGFCFAEQSFWVTCELPCGLLVVRVMQPCPASGFVLSAGTAHWVHDWAEDFSWGKLWRVAGSPRHRGCTRRWSCREASRPGLLEAMGFQQWEWFKVPWVCEIEAGGASGVLWLGTECPYSHREREPHSCHPLWVLFSGTTQANRQQWGCAPHPHPACCFWRFCPALPPAPSPDCISQPLLMGYLHSGLWAEPDGNHMAPFPIVFAKFQCD